MLCHFCGLPFRDCQLGGNVVDSNRTRLTLTKSDYLRALPTDPARLPLIYSRPWVPHPFCLHLHHGVQQHSVTRYDQAFIVPRRVWNIRTSFMDETYEPREIFSDILFASSWKQKWYFDGLNIGQKHIIIVESETRSSTHNLQSSLSLRSVASGISFPVGLRSLDNTTFVFAFVPSAAERSIMKGTFLRSSWADFNSTR